MSIRTFALLCCVLSLSVRHLGAQTTTATEPLIPRGILPGSLQVASTDDDVSISSGNLLSRVPLYRFPGGPGSVAMDIGLVYNSSIWEPSYVSNSCPDNSCAPYSLTYNQSQTGGGWNYTFNYQLTIESAPATVSNCAPGVPGYGAVRHGPCSG